MRCSLKILAVRVNRDCLGVAPTQIDILKALKHGLFVRRNLVKQPFDTKNRLISINHQMRKRSPGDVEVAEGLVDALQHRASPAGVLIPLSSRSLDAHKRNDSRMMDKNCLDGCHG